MTDPNLTGALRGSLDMMTNNQPPDGSPLTEADPDAINQFLDEVNADLVAGMPEKVTDERLKHMVDIFRAKALFWEQEQEVKKTKTRTKRSTAEAIDIDLFN